MELNLIGLNHKTAPLSIREKFVFSSDLISHALLDLKKNTGSKAVILSTCNRTEIYFLSTKVDKVCKWLADFHQVKLSQLKKHLYIYKNKEVIIHSYRVAAGLDSMILGETQILGQMKQASKIANFAGTQGKFLDTFFQKSFQSAKEVRTKTEIGSSTTTIASTILKISKRIFGEIEKTRILFIGASDMAEMCAKYFNKHNPQKISIANRSIQNGRTMAKKINADAFLLGEITEQLHYYDIVVSSTSSQLPIIGLGMIERAIKARKHKPMLLIDLAMPRDIENEASEVSDIFLYTFDDLAKIAQEGKSNRSEAVKKAEILINSKATEFFDKEQQKKTIPTILSLRNQIENIRIQELKKAQNDIKKGLPVEKILEKLSNNLSKKFLHHPSKALNSSQKNNEISDLLKIIYDLKE